MSRFSDELIKALNPDWEFEDEKHYNMYQMGRTGALLQAISFPFDDLTPIPEDIWNNFINGKPH